LPFSKYAVSVYMPLSRLPTLTIDGHSDIVCSRQTTPPIDVIRIRTICSSEFIVISCPWCTGFGYIEIVSSSSKITLTSSDHKILYLARAHRACFLFEFLVEIHILWLFSWNNYQTHGGVQALIGGSRCIWQPLSDERTGLKQSFKTKNANAKNGLAAKIAKFQNSFATLRVA